MSSIVSSTNVGSAFTELLTTYHEFNPARVESVDGAPTSLQFARYVAKNQPVVFRGAIASWEAIKKWKVGYLKQKMEGRDINVAMTPFGNADSVVSVNGVDYFVQPHSLQEPFAEFVDYVRAPVKESTAVKYAQSQDNNLHGEYLPLLSDIPADVGFATEFFERQPDATNIWIGNDRSVTALHKDHYENLYCQVSGKKNFVILSPLEVACIEERELPSAKYVPDAEGKWKIMPDEPEDWVAGWATVDPDSPLERAGVFWKYSRPLRVTLEPGDMFYLPAMWYHKVSQECGEEGICCAVNYWYDMDFSGLFYSTIWFVRTAAPILQDEIKELENDRSELKEGETVVRTD
ncbi:cupin-like domain-containing protein [Morchella snyderi]|nr:cupin-like domain-containing protein [Morchella snyderi]